MALQRMVLKIPMVIYLFHKFAVKMNAEAEIFSINLLFEHTPEILVSMLLVITINSLRLSNFAVVNDCRFGLWLDLYDQAIL